MRYHARDGCSTSAGTSPEPGQAAYVQLAPGATGAERPTGLYRATFSYSLSSDGGGQPIAVDSPTFTISPMS